MAIPFENHIRPGYRIYDIDGERYDIQSVRHGMTIGKPAAAEGTVMAITRDGKYRTFEFSELIPDGLKAYRVARPEEHTPQTVSHPDYYGGAADPYEVIKVAEAWGLDQDAYLFNVTKYIARAGKKNKDTRLEDLQKARFYLDRRINRIEEENQ